MCCMSIILPGMNLDTEIHSFISLHSSLPQVGGKPPLSLLVLTLIGTNFSCFQFKCLRSLLLQWIYDAGLKWIDHRTNRILETPN